MKRTSSTVKENSLLVNKVSHKAIDEAIFKTMKIAKTALHQNVKKSMEF